MALTRRYLTLLLVGVFSALGLHLRAQAPAEVPPSFRLLSLGEAEPISYDLERKPRTVYLTTNNYSSAHPLPSNGALNFYRLKTNADPKLPPERIPVAEIKIPPDSPKPVIIILIPGGLPGRPVPTLENGKPAEFASIILDDSPAASPRDHLRVISFSKRPVGVKFGESTAQLAPFENKLFAYPSGNRTALLVATFSMESWQPIVSTVQMLAPNTRITLLFSDPPHKPGEMESRDLFLRKIVEVLPPPAR
jgi:hypothetical protein